VLTLSQFVDGDLDPAMALRVEAHLGDCEDCRGTVADFQSVNQRVTEVGSRVVRVPMEVSESVRLDTSRGRTTGRIGIVASARSMPAAVGTVAAAVLLFIGSGFLHHASGPTTPSSRASTPVVKPAKRFLRQKFLSMEHSGAGRNVSRSASGPKTGKPTPPRRQGHTPLMPL